MPALEDKAAYNLGVVVQETGINPDTLRAWERRYGLPDPARSAGGHRLYSQADIDLVRWLKERQKEGMRIGRAVQLWTDLKKEGLEPFKEHPLPEGDPLFNLEDGEGVDWAAGDQGVYQQIQQDVLEAAVNFEEQKAEQILSQAFARFSPTEVWIQIILPVLGEVGKRWKQNLLTVQQEHFISSLISRRLGAQIESAPLPIREESLLVGCPPGERHEFSLLIITLLLRRRGYRVVYLGADVPRQDLDQAIRSTNPNLILLAAQTLSAAASLKQVAAHIQDLGVPIAFGGGVYNRIPELRDRSLGFFLGEEISSVVSAVEKLIQRPSAVISAGQMMPKEFNHTLSAYLAVERQVADLMIQFGSDYGLEEKHLHLANDYLLQGLKASMELGNLDYLHPDLSWLGQLLSFREISQDQIKHYLGIYAEQLEAQGGASVELVVSWLRLAREKLVD